MKGQVEEKGELQLLRSNPLHPRGKLLWLACVDHTTRAEFILCYELWGQHGFLKQTYPNASMWNSRPQRPRGRVGCFKEQMPK